MKQKKAFEKLHNYFKKNQTLAILLTISLIIFSYGYWTNVFRPAANFDRGWYEIWADQKRYYIQAQAISKLQLNAENFYYPILYPLLGAIFIPIFPNDPFFIVNAFLFLITIALTYELIKKTFNKQSAIFGTLALLMVNRFVYDFVTPWNTSITTALFLVSVYITFTNKFSKNKLILLTFLSGFAALARYTDIFFFLPLIGGFILKTSSKNKRPEYLLKVGLILFAFFVCFVSLNFLTSGSFLGSYVNRQVTKFGLDFRPSVIAEKTFGYFINPFIFHQQIEYFSVSAVVSFPLLLVLFSFIAILVQLIKNEKWHVKISHLSLFTSMSIWYSSNIIFEGITPFTLRNLSLHYIKPWYAIVVFYIVYIVQKVLIKKNISNITLKHFFIPALMILLVPIATQLCKPRIISNTFWKFQSNSSENLSMISDNSLDNVWVSDKPRSVGNYILIDLGKKHLINKLKLVDTPELAVTNFDTYLSTDGVYWKKIAPNQSFNVRQKDYWNIVGYIQPAQYIKIVLNEESENKWGISELYVYGY